jgi:hypothetical protein
MRENIIFFTINIRNSRVFNSKYRGFTEFINSNYKIQNIENINQAIDQDIFQLDDAVKILLLDSRFNIDYENIKILLLKFDKIFLMCNHFFVSSLSIRTIVEYNFDKIVFVLENEASSTLVSEYYGVKINLDNKIIFIPIVDCKDDNKKFEKISTIERSETIIRNVLHVGSIFIHRKNDNWWQKKFTTCQYYPDRLSVSLMADELEINNCSRIIFRDDKFYRIINYFYNCFGKDYWISNSNSYYSIDLLNEYSSSSFVIAVNDIFSVIPQIIFQSMKSGLILIGTNSEAFVSLGFVDGFNYISVGDKFSFHSLRGALDRIKLLSINDINNLRLESTKHVEYLEHKMISNFNNFVVTSSSL